MKHDWKIIYKAMLDDRKAKHAMQYRHRVCENCGAEQMHDAQYEWMRVVGYHWYPKIGRCKPPQS